MTERIERWLTDLVSKTIVPEDIVAMYCGMYETEDGFCLYLTGSEEYNEDDEDWACNHDFEFPSSPLCLSSEETSVTDWEDFQDKVVDILKTLSNKPALASLFCRPFYAGFDDGNLILIKSAKLHVKKMKDSRGIFGWQFPKCMISFLRKTLPIGYICTR